MGDTVYLARVIYPAIVLQSSHRKVTCGEADLANNDRKIIARFPKCDESVWYFTRSTRCKDFSASWNPYAVSTKWNIRNHHTKGVLHLIHDGKATWLPTSAILGNVWVYLGSNTLVNIAKIFTTPKLLFQCRNHGISNLTRLGARETMGIIMLVLWRYIFITFVRQNKFLYVTITSDRVKWRQSMFPPAE